MIALRRTISGLALAIALVSGATATATDYTALREDARVHGELLAASLAYLVDENCDSMGLRKLKMTAAALSLQAYARGLGYTNAEISAYVDSKDEQARFRAIAEPYLASLGAVMGDGESYCVAGRALQENGTLAGAFLSGG